MDLDTVKANENIRFEPDERPPHSVAAGVGFQAAVVVLAPVVLSAVIIARAANQPASYLTWVAFAALMVSGVSTVLQAVRIGRIGAGHVLIMGTSGAFIAVCITALVKGGPPLMASLIVVSSLFQFLLAARLSLVRRIITPVVSGTVIMLIAVTVMPVVFDLLGDVPDDTPAAAAPAAAAATLAALLVLALRAPVAWRLWAPLIAIVVGCAVSAPFGLYAVQPVLEAAWIGFPDYAWPGLDLSLSAEFWALLPAFVVVTMVGAIETIGDGVAIQRVSRRRPRGNRFSPRPGRSQRRRGGQSAFRARRHAPQYDLLHQHIPRRAHRGRRPPRRRVYRRPLRVAGAVAQGDGPHHRHSQPGWRRLRNPADRHPLRAGNEDRRRGRPRSPQGRGGGSRLLDRRRLPEPGDLRRPAGRDLGHPARQRHDRRGDRGDRADRLPGADGTPEPASQGRAGRFGAAGNRRLPARLCLKNRLERAVGRGGCAPQERKPWLSCCSRPKRKTRAPRGGA